MMTMGACSSSTTDESSGQNEDLTASTQSFAGAWERQGTQGSILRIVFKLSAVGGDDDGWEVFFADCEPTPLPRKSILQFTCNRRGCSPHRDQGRYTISPLTNGPTLQLADSAHFDSAEQYLVTMTGNQLTLKDPQTGPVVERLARVPNTCGVASDCDAQEVLCRNQRNCAAAQLTASDHYSQGWSCSAQHRCVWAGGKSCTNDSDCGATEFCGQKGISIMERECGLSQRNKEKWCRPRPTSCPESAPMSPDFQFCGCTEGSQGPNAHSTQCEIYRTGQDAFDCSSPD